MKTWVKLYTKIVADPDIAALPLDQIGIWALLLALAGCLDDRDKGEVETGKLDTTERIAWHLRQPIEIIDKAITTFQDLEMMHAEEGCWYITKYGVRQQRPPSSRPTAVKGRVQAWRASQAERECNDVTSSLRPRSLSVSDSVSESNSVSDSFSVSVSSLSLIYTRWQEARGGTINAIEAEEIGALVDEFGEQAVLDAIGEAVRANRRDRPSINFLAAIVRNPKRPKQATVGALVVDPGGVA